MTDLPRSLRELSEFLMPQNAELVRLAADSIESLEAQNDRLKGALQEWIDGKCISQKYLTMIGDLQQSLAKAKHEQALAVDDAAVANNMLKLVYDHLRSCPGMTGGED